MAPTIKLTYFAGRGRAEAIRHALTVGGIEFEDVRVSGEKFMEMKNDGTLPFGSLPVIEIDGEMIAESCAILRYAGQIGGTYPKDPVAACKVDMVVDNLEGMVVKMWANKTEEHRSKIVKEDIPRYFKPLDDIYAKSDGPFLLGNELSIADIKLYGYLWFISEGILDHVPKDCLDCFVHLQTAAKAVAKNEKIAAWNEAHKCDLTQLLRNFLARACRVVCNSDRIVKPGIRHIFQRRGEVAGRLYSRFYIMQPGHLDEKLSLVMAAATNGLDDAVLNAPLPDMSLPGDPHVQHVPHVPSTSAELQGASHQLLHNEDPQHTLGLIQELNSHSHTHQPTVEVSVGIITGESHVNTDNNNMDLSGVTAGDTLDNENTGNTTDTTGERPAKRRRGGRRVSNPNMTAEERRRQRVLKNRESAMRSLQKKAEYSANLAVEQKAVTAAHEAKKSQMYTLVSTAAALREKLDGNSNNELALSIANCIERCNSLLQNSSSTTTIPNTTVRSNPPTSTANINVNISNIDTNANANPNTEDTPTTTLPENHNININHNMNITNVPPAVPQAAIPLVPPIILPAGSTAHPPLPPH